MPARQSEKSHWAPVSTPNRHALSSLRPGSYHMPRMLLIAALVALGAATCHAQDYPSRPVRIVFPLAAGGGGDIYSRGLADELQKAWHQPVVVENRPGGGQVIGARACAEATPDGYTICVMSSEPVAYNQFL